MNEESKTFMWLSIFLLTIFVISYVINMNERDDMMNYCTEFSYINQENETIGECRMLKCLNIHVLTAEEQELHSDKLKECYP